ncbi:MAG TPA: hypothetical protein VIP98_19355 [Microlunatus sp.]
MQLGAEVAVIGRQPGKRSVDHIGTGRVIHPYAVQVDNGLAEAMRAAPHRAEKLILSDPKIGTRFPVDRIRPGLVSPDEAASILASNLPQLQLLPVDKELVFLETAEPLFGGELMVADQPWWCRILCLKSCTSC